MPPMPVGTGAGAGPLVGLGTSASPLTWWGVALVLAAGAAWRMLSTHEPRGEVVQPPALSETTGGEERREARGELGRLPVVSEEREEVADSESEESAGVRASQPRTSLVTPLEVPEIMSVVAAPAASGERIDFDWPQYGGGPAHDGSPVREDEIFAPKVLWFVPGCAGQPTLLDGDLYSGGIGILRIDAATGNVLAAQDPRKEEDRIAVEHRGGLLGMLESGVVKKEDLPPAVQEMLEDWELEPIVADSPALTRELVITRRLSDGGVVAFDRALENQIWSWPPVERRQEVSSRSAQVPLCLAGADLVLAAHHSKLVALKVADGEEAWSCTVNGRIDVVPACADGRVFCGTDRGLFFALELQTGNELWHASSVKGGWMNPVVVGRRVLAADSVLSGWRFSGWKEGPTELEPDASEHERGHLCAFDAKSGKELWRTAFEGYGLSLPGVGPKQDYVVAGFGSEVARFALASGKRDEKHRVKTGPHPFGTPTVVGKSLVFGDLDGSLYVHELETSELRWSFRPAGAKVFDFVHTGTHIFVSTSIGLFCLGDDPTRSAVGPGFLLSWAGDTTRPSFQPEKH